MRGFKKSLALLLALAMVLSTFAVTVVSAQTFGDTSGHWAETLIDKWSDNGVLGGYEDGTFRPDDNITRAELAKIIATAKGYDEMADISFADVSGDEWFVTDLKKCVAKGVIGGYEDGTFRPDNYITREEASTMFVRAYNINASAVLNFTDTYEISEWAKTAVTALVGAGVISGYEDGSFMPSASITRAEVVKILDGAVNVNAASPQATSSTSGTNSVGTIGNLGGSGSSGSSGGAIQPTSKFRVTLNANGGVFNDSTKTKTVTVGKNGVLGTKAEEPTRDGMMFGGWFTSMDAAENLIASKKWEVTSPVTKTMTLYAGWYTEGTVIVSFETNGGTPSVASQTIESGETATEPTETLTRANYTFVGWYTQNVGGAKVNFSDAIRANTRFYARWKVDAAYAASEVTIPSTTSGSYQNGTVEASPSSALPGETVKISITAPTGFDLSDVPTITYVSSESGLSSTISGVKALGGYDFSFVMPNDVESGSLKIETRYATAIPTIAPATPEPTLDPSVPTPTPELIPTYYFSDEAFSELGGTLPANTEVGGVTVSKAATIDASSKTFNGSGYKYTMRCKIGTATLSFKVTGTCQIMIDAASASSEDRIYEVYAGSKSLGTFTCLNGGLDTATFNYTGGAETITIKPKAGINVYGIFVNYSAEVPTAAPVPTETVAPPTPTVDPNTVYDIAIADDIVNGSIDVKAGSVSSENINTVKWTAADCVPEGAVAGDTPIFGSDAATVNLNGKDATDGTLTIYEEAHYYDWVWTEENGGDGKTYRYIRGENNPAASPPFSDANQPGGAAFRIDAAKDGYITLELYVYTGKHFHLYDNNAANHIEDFTTTSESKHTFTFACEQSNSYYFWADGSKIGVISATYHSNVLRAKAGDTITVTTKPNTGFKTQEVVVNPSTAVTASGNNTYTFKMPASDVTVGAKFASESGAPDPTATVNPNTEYDVKVADGITGGTLQIVQTPAPTAAPTATPVPLTVINGEYTFIADTYTNASSGTSTDIAAGSMLDGGKVYSAKGNKSATNKNKSIIDGAQVPNSIRVKEANATLLVELGQASDIVVYSNNDLAKDRHVILGTTAGGTDISTACVPTEEEVTDGVKSVVTTFTNVPAGRVYISGSGDLYLAGFKISPTGSATVAMAEDTNSEIYTSAAKAKAGQVITVKAVADNPSDAITITTDPSVTVTDAGNGYYTFTMPAANTTINAQFGDSKPAESFVATLDVVGGTGSLVAGDATVSAAADDSWTASEAPALGSSINIGDSLVLTFGVEGDSQIASVKTDGVLTGTKEQATAFTFKNNQISGNNNGGVVDEASPNTGTLADGTTVTWTKVVAPTITDGTATIPNSGTFYKLDASKSGSVVVKGKVGSGKKFAFLDATAPEFLTDSSTGTLYDGTTALSANLTTIEVNLTAGHTYYMLGLGTKMSLESISFTAESSGDAPAEPTVAPATEAPSTEAPSTEAPSTEAPSTEAPATEAPATEAPATEAPTATPAPTAEPTLAPNEYKFTAGATVTFVGTPNNAGETATMTVVGADGTSVPVDGLTFTMPSQNVTVTVTYSAATVPGTAASWSAPDYIAQYESGDGPMSHKIGDLTMQLMEGAWGINQDPHIYTADHFVNGVKQDEQLVDAVFDCLQASGNTAVGDTSVAETTGSVFKFSTTTKGTAKLQTWFHGSGGGNIFTIVKFAAGELNDGVEVIAQADHGSVAFFDYDLAVEPGYDYYVYNNGSRLGMRAVDFIPEGAAVPTAAPTAEPTQAPTAEPTAEPTQAPVADENGVTVITASNFTFNRTGENDSRPGLNADFTFGTATDAYTPFVSIFGENASKAGNKAVNYNGKQFGNTSFKFTPSADGDYTMYLLAIKANNTANTRVTVSTDADNMVAFDVSDPVDGTAVVLTSKTKFTLSAGVEYTFTIQPETQASQYTGDFAAAALALEK